MTTASALLPTASFTLERAYADATDLYARTYDAVTSMRGLKLVNPPPSFLPFLVYEYGLGELTPYVPNLYDLVDEGIDWQRVRGTPKALEIALAWVGYLATLEEFPTRRARWNHFMLEFDRVRDEAPGDLINIAGVAELSVPVRSVFWRGFAGYDVRALEYGHKRWGGSLWSSYSGVRIPETSPKWSFGRVYDLIHEMTQAELEALGVWIEPTGDALVWGDFPWPDVPWVDAAGENRSIVMLDNAPDGPAWVVFKDADGEVIGYRRARARRRVVPDLAGIYTVSNTRFSVQSSGTTRLYVEAMTGFGDANGRTAAFAGVILGAVPLAPHKPGALWLPAGGLSAVGPILGERAVNIEFGRTVRERVRTILRF